MWGDPEDTEPSNSDESSLSVEGAPHPQGSSTHIHTCLPVHRSSGSPTPVLLASPPTVGCFFPLLSGGTDCVDVP